MDSREKFKLLETRASSVLGLQADEVTDGLRSVVESVATDLVVDLTKLGNETPDLKNLTESLISDINAKRKELREEFPFQKKGKEDKDSSGEDDGDEDDKFKKKKKKKKNGEEDEKDEKNESIYEETQGTIDTGIHRSIPVEAPPPPGEGWPISPGDAGVLAAINDGTNEFMAQSQNVVEEYYDEKDAELAESEGDYAPTLHDALIEVALKVTSMEESDENFVARAFAAAFLMESGKRLTESQAYARIVNKLQEKFQEAAETGEVVLSEADEVDEELAAKYEAAVTALDELQTRHRLLSAKVYAEQELGKLGLRENATARKNVAEAIRKAATKSSIDEAISALASVKGLKVNALVQPEARPVNEAAQPMAENLEGTVAKLNTSTKSTGMSSAEMGKRLSQALSFSRSR